MATARANLINFWDFDSLSPDRAAADEETPQRPAPPQREATPLRREATPLRREATPLRREATPLQRDPTPLRRDPTPTPTPLDDPAPIERSQELFPRTPSEPFPTTPTASLTSAANEEVEALKVLLAQREEELASLRREAEPVPVTPITCCCTDFLCLKELNLQEMDHNGWLKSHGFYHARCDEHGTSDLKEGKGFYTCWAKKAGKYCRTRVPAMNPHVKASTLFKALHTIAFGIPLGKACADLQAGDNVHRNTLGPVLRNITKCALAACQAQVPQSSRIQVDETCIGRRKFQKGKRARVEQYWFWTATSVARDGTTTGTYWKACTRRTKVEAEKFIATVVLGKKTHIATDCAKCYGGLQASGYIYHKSVNHSITFKSEDGTHTNQAENCHQVVKKCVRTIWGGFGKTGDIVEERAALGSKLYLGGTPINKLIILLHMVKEYWGKTPTYTLDRPIVVDEEAADGNSEGGSESEDEGDDQEEEDVEVPARLQVLSPAVAYVSLGTTKQGCCEAVRMVLQHHNVPFVDQLHLDFPQECGPVPRGFAKLKTVALVMWHNNHFLAGVTDMSLRRVYILDSRRTHKVDSREVVITAWLFWLKKAWGGRLPVKAIARSSIKQESPGGDIDNVIHVINNIFSEIGVAEAPTYDRTSVRKLLKSLAEEAKGEEKLKAAIEAKSKAASEAKLARSEAAAKAKAEAKKKADAAKAKKAEAAKKVKEEKEKAEAAKKVKEEKEKAEAGKVKARKTSAKAGKKAAQK